MSLSNPMVSRPAWQPRPAKFRPRAVAARRGFSEICPETPCRCTQPLAAYHGGTAVLGWVCRATGLQSRLDNVQGSGHCRCAAAREATRYQLNTKGLLVLA